MGDSSILNFGRLIEGLEQDLGVPLETIARALGVDHRTVERWRAHRNVPRRKAWERLAELVDLRDRLLRTFDRPEVAQAWLRTGSRHLGGVSPQEALAAGRLNPVRSDLDGLAAGVYL